MDVDRSVIVFVATTYYNITPKEDSITALDGYYDKNFSFSDKQEGKKYVLKIINNEDSIEQLTEIIDEIIDSIFDYCHKDPSRQFVTAKLMTTSANRLSGQVDIRYQSDEDGQLRRCHVKLFEFFPGISLKDFINESKPRYMNEELYSKLGLMCNQLFRFLRTKRHLLFKLKEVRRDFVWQLVTCDTGLQQLAKSLYPDTDSKRRGMIDRALSEFRDVSDRVSCLPEFILFGDLNGRNILINPDDAQRLCLIDFQDIQIGPQVAEVAIFALYSILEQRHLDMRRALRLIPYWIISGYQSGNKYRIPDEELDLIATLMKLRICQSLLRGELAIEMDPDNRYVTHTSKPCWLLLELMTSDTPYSNPKRLADWWQNGSPVDDLPEEASCEKIWAMDPNESAV